MIWDRVQKCCNSKGTIAFVAEVSFMLIMFFLTTSVVWLFIRPSGAMICDKNCLSRTCEVTSCGEFGDCAVLGQTFQCSCLQTEQNVTSYSLCRDKIFDKHAPDSNLDLIMFPMMLFGSFVFDVLYIFCHCWYKRFHDDTLDDELRKRVKERRCLSFLSCYGSDSANAGYKVVQRSDKEVVDIEFIPVWCWAASEARDQEKRNEQKICSEQVCVNAVHLMAMLWFIWFCLLRKSCVLIDVRKNYICFRISMILTKGMRHLCSMWLNRHS